MKRREASDDGCRRLHFSERNGWALAFPQREHASERHEFARLVEEKTEGRIKIEVFTGGTLYKAEPDSIQALQLGDLAFARVSASPVGNFVPAINGIQMPYLYKSGAHMWAVLNSEIGQNFLAEIEKAPNSGLVLL